MDDKIDYVSKNKRTKCMELNNETSVTYQCDQCDYKPTRKSCLNQHTESDHSVNTHG